MLLSIYATWWSDFRGDAICTTNIDAYTGEGGRTSQNCLLFGSNSAAVCCLLLMAMFFIPDIVYCCTEVGS